VRCAAEPRGEGRAQQVLDLRIGAAQLGRRQALDLGPQDRIDAQQERLLVGTRHRRSRSR
jgi:hypothetical protein